jgi:hypothetical protein
MEFGGRRARRLAATATVALTAAAWAGTAHATVTPAQLVKALQKAPPEASLPYALRGGQTRRGALSPGSRSHHAVGAVAIGNTSALVGYLVFPTHALAVADLKAFPPNRGPNEIVTAHPAGFPRPAYIVKADGNGYTVAYAIFIQDNVLVNAWTYGQKGTQKQLIRIAEQNARWAGKHLAAAARGGK